MSPKAQPRRQTPRGSTSAKQNEEASKLAIAKEDVMINSNTQGASSDPGLSGPSNSSNAASTLPIVPGASSPPRQSSQRLASLHLKGFANPNSNSIAQETPGARLKIQPKSSLRRSKETREALEKAEAERRQSKAASENSTNATFSNRGGLSNRSRGGRGLFPGNRFGVERLASNQATGHLGGGTVGEEGNRKRRNARGGLLSGVQRVSTPSISTSTKNTSEYAKKDIAVKPEKDMDGDAIIEPSSTKKRPAIKEEGHAQAYVSSDDEPDTVEGPRINIEHINLISDDETGDETNDFSKMSEGIGQSKEPKIPNWSLKPIRVDRHEHVDRAVGVNTDPSSLTSAELRRKAKERGEAEGSLFLDGDEESAVIKPEKLSGWKKPKDVEFLRDERRWKGVYQDEEDRVEEPKIKDEPKEIEDPIIIDTIDTNTSSPQPGNLDTTTAISGIAVRKGSNELAAHQREVKLRGTKWSRISKPVLQTEEDHQEWARYERDLLLLGEELRSVAADPVRASTTSVLDQDGDIKLDDCVDNIKDRKEDLVYLFQLPPIVPGLSTSTKTDNQDKFKEDSKDQADPRESTHVSKSASNIKPITTSENHPNNTLPKAFNALNLTCPNGRLGTMRLYDTGRVMATWGGASMELGRGGGGGLLQEVVVTDCNRTRIKVEDEGNKQYENKSGAVKEEGKEKEKERWEEKIDLGDKGWAIGGLAGGFIMTPDWGRMV